MYKGKIVKNILKYITLWSILLYIPFDSTFSTPIDTTLLISQDTKYIESLKTIIQEMSLLLKNHIASIEEINKFQFKLDTLQQELTVNSVEKSKIINEKIDQAYTVLNKLKTNLKLFYKTIKKSSNRLNHEIIIPTSDAI